MVAAAYPFSATATPHTVQITGGAVAYAMCAIDALGIAEMLGARGLEIETAEQWRDALALEPGVRSAADRAD